MGSVVAASPGFHMRLSPPQSPSRVLQVIFRMLKLDIGDDGDSPKTHWWEPGDRRARPRLTAHSNPASLKTKGEAVITSNQVASLTGVAAALQNYVAVQHFASRLPPACCLNRLAEDADAARSRGRHAVKRSDLPATLARSRLASTTR